MLGRLFNLFMEFSNVGFRYILVPENEEFYTGGKTVPNKCGDINIIQCTLLLNRA